MRTIEKSPEPVSSNGHQATKHGGDHVFIVPFAMEDGGTLGAHALALLKMLAEYVTVAPKGCYSSRDSRRSPLTPAPHAICIIAYCMQVCSLWMQRWQQRLSTWLHVSLPQQILRLYCTVQCRPAGARLGALG